MILGIVVWNTFWLLVSRVGYNNEGYSYASMVSCKNAVPQAPSLGRFDVLLQCFEVEKCRLCLLFVGEKYAKIDK